MRMICVDNDGRALRKLVKLCLDIPNVSDVKGFANEPEALVWIRDNPCDVAIMETRKPGFNGLKLAGDAKKLRPELAILFVTDERDYGLDAFQLHATGYLLKPVTRERLVGEIEYAEEQRMRRAALR